MNEIPAIHPSYATGRRGSPPGTPEGGADQTVQVGLDSFGAGAVGHDQGALPAAASHCTVHNTLHQPPEIGVELAP